MKSTTPTRRGRTAASVLALTFLLATATAAVANDDRLAPPRPLLPDDVAARVAELDAEIERLQELNDCEAAIVLAEEILALRLEHQGAWTDADGDPADWWEVGDARRAIDDLVRLDAMSPDERVLIARATHAPSEIEALDGAARYAEAAALAEAQHEACLRLLGEEHPLTLRLLGWRGWLIHVQGRPADGELLIRRTVDGLRRNLGAEHPDTLSWSGDLSSVLKTQGRLTEAEPYGRSFLEGSRRVLGDDDLNTLIALNNLGHLLDLEGKPSEAEPFFRAALDGFARTMGDEHQHTLMLRNNLGHVLRRQGRWAEAEPFVREALNGLRRTLGDAHPDTLITMSNMALHLQAQGKLTEAEPYAREALDGMRRVLADDAHLTLQACNNLGYLLRYQGRSAEAERYYREALEGCRRTLGDDHRLTMTCSDNLGGALMHQGRLAEAEPYFREGLARFRRVFGDEDIDTQSCVGEMGALLAAQGKLAEAEPYFREDIEVRRRLLGDEHPSLLYPLVAMASVLARQGRLDEAESYYLQAITLAERLRTAVIGAERDRADYAGTLRLSVIASGYAAVLVRDGRGGEALGMAERGRSRALLDLLERQGLDVVEAARRRAAPDEQIALTLERALAEEARARAAVTEAVARVEALRTERGVHAAREDLSAGDRTEALTAADRQVADQIERVATARRQAFEAGRRVLTELHGLIPDAHPLSTAEIVAGLDPGELLLAYAWTKHGVVLMAAESGAGTEGIVLAADENAVNELAHAVSAVREAIATRPVDARAAVDAADLLERLIPPAARSRLARAKRIVVVPDGPLHDLPFEVLLECDPALADPSAVYAASATMFLNRRNAGGPPAPGAMPTALVLGDPVFDRERPEEPDHPASGVMVAFVGEDSNAALGGVYRGDVIRSYAGRDVDDRAALVSAIGEVNGEVERGERPADDRVPVIVWRDGAEIEATLAPGRMGVNLDTREPADALRSRARLERGFEALGVEASTLDQVRLHGGRLAALPGTRREALAIARVVEAAGGSATLLTGGAATVTSLTAEAPGKRYVHVATHGLTGSSERPYDASLALTQPAETTPADIGFLRLDDLIRSWRGRLEGCDLVILSACDTGRGIEQGDSVMALPWGFFYAGAPTVIASLWKADDTATALLMTRLYENLLGQHDAPRHAGERTFTGGQPMSKIDALREAKGWLRTLTWAEARRFADDLSSLARGPIEPAPRRGSDLRDGHPFAHPYFWAGFVLIGSPE